MGAEHQPTERTAGRLTDEVERTVATVFAQPEERGQVRAQNDVSQRARPREEGTFGR